ncbi:hypothetical protein DEH84_09610 [Aquabacterium olei]|uniref:Uncharacterized protein n=1 Tax=Aquabacterium olei TaxID=1296669 RepID=A0A2U8FRH0_9BURK|nr:hypothetical protein [Aquabacterium olei]AWI53662.1 hypothetical protein DEH84_09610 [Aquabacterium olei]
MTFSDGALPAIEWVMVLGCLAATLPFKPWLPLRHRELQSPWLGAMVILPFAWWTRHLLPSGLALHVSGACLLVLMFGWPLAVWSITLVGVLTAALEAFTPPRLNAHQRWMNEALPAIQGVTDLGPRLLHQADAIAAQVAWLGVLPATLGLLLGLAVRRFMPAHLFVFILGRGFIVTALSVTLAGLAAAAIGRVPEGIDTGEWLLAHWLLGWGEAISTGMLTAIFVAFKPHWMLTYSDQRYLAGPHRPGP